MTDLDGKEMAQGILTQMADFRKSCEGLDEKNSSRSPEGRWSPRQIISHLSGPEGVGHLPMLRSFIERDTPEIELKVEDPFWSGKRNSMSLAELLDEFDGEYVKIARFVEGLSGEQLSRKAHIPALKDSPLGEYPTLAQFVAGLSTYHIGFHIDHMKAILKDLGVPGK